MESQLQLRDIAHQETLIVHGQVKITKVQGVPICNKQQFSASTISKLGSGNKATYDACPSIQLTSCSLAQSSTQR